MAYTERGWVVKNTLRERSNRSSKKRLDTRIYPKGLSPRTCEGRRGCRSRGVVGV